MSDAGSTVAADSGKQRTGRGGQICRGTRRDGRGVIFSACAHDVGGIVQCRGVAQAREREREGVCGQEERGGAIDGPFGLIGSCRPCWQHSSTTTLHATPCTASSLWLWRNASPPSRRENASSSRTRANCANCAQTFFCFFSLSLCAAPTARTAASLLWALCIRIIRWPPVTAWKKRKSIG